MAEQGHDSSGGGNQALQAAALGAHTMARANRQQRSGTGTVLSSSSYGSLAALASIPHPQHQSLPHFSDQKQQQIHLHQQLQSQLNKSGRVGGMEIFQGLPAHKMMGNKSQKLPQHQQKQRKEDSSEAPQLYETSKMRRPELWQFIRLVVPDPPHIAAGKDYTNQDAKQAYCLKCKKFMHYNTGSSNNVSRHMTKFHPAEILQFQKKQLKNKKKKKKSKKDKNVVTTHTPPFAQGQRDDSSTLKTTEEDEIMEQPRKRQRIEDSNPISLTDDASQTNSTANVSTSQETDVSCGTQLLEKLPSTESDDYDTNQRNSMLSSSSANSLTGALQSSSNIPRPGLTRQESSGSNLLCEDSEVEVAQHLNTLVAKWVCKRYHSFSITEDRDLQAILDYAVALGKQVNLPNLNAVRNSVGSLSAKMRLDLLRQLSQECYFFSTTTDVWSTIEKDVYVSFGIHFLTENFEMRHITLDVKEFVGMTQSMDTLKELLELTLSRWNLDMRYSNVLLWQSNCFQPSSPDPLSAMRSPLDRSPLFLRPQSPALVQNTQIQIESIAHALQLILGKVFYSTKKPTDSWSGFYVFDQQLHDAIDKIPTQFRSGIEFINGQVEYFRELSSILATHPSAVTRINKLMAAGALNHLPRFLTDSKSDWLTTLEMLRRMVKLRGVIQDFFIYLDTTEGKHEFQTSTSGNLFPESLVTRTPPSTERWITIECLLQMLQPLENVMRAINKEKFTPLALIFPLLRFLSRDLDKKKNLSNINTPEFQTIMRRYGIDSYRIDSNQTNKLTEISQHIETLRGFFHEEFVDKFTRISSDLVWISQLDPRFIRMKYLGDEEREQCKQILAENAVEMANLLHLLSITQQKSKQHLLGSGNSSANSSSNNLSGSSGGGTVGTMSASSSFLDLQGRNDEHDTNMFLRELLFEEEGGSQSGSAEGTPEPSSFSSCPNMHFHTHSFEEQEALRVRASEEVEQFYQQVSTEQVRDPLLWWRSNTSKYQLLAPLARKWLGAMGSITPSEVLNFTSKEMNSLGSNSRMDPEVVRDMVFVHDNS